MKNIAIERGSGQYRIVYTDLQQKKLLVIRSLPGLYLLDQGRVVFYPSVFVTASLIHPKHLEYMWKNSYLIICKVEIVLKSTYLLTTEEKWSIHYKENKILKGAYSKFNFYTCGNNRLRRMNIHRNDSCIMKFISLKLMFTGTIFRVPHSYCSV